MKLKKIIDVLEDYQKMEDNVKELLDLVASLQDEIKKLHEENIELEGKQKAFDFSSSVRAEHFLYVQV